MIKVYGHRGYSGRYPENTMLAFKKAIEVGADGIELDVQITKDGHLVIIHDETIDRTTDGTGCVKDYTLEELRRFNASKNWPEYGFQPIPTFEEYCQWAAENGVYTNVEIKSGVYYYERIEEKTLEMVRKYGLSDKILFSSFLHSSITILRKLAPEIKCGALVEYDGLHNAGYYCDKMNYQCFHPGKQCMDKTDVDDCKQYGIEVNVWTVNDMDSLQKLCEWGVDGLITNYPPTCLAYVKSLNK